MLYLMVEFKSLALVLESFSARQQHLPWALFRLVVETIATDTPSKQSNHIYCFAAQNRGASNAHQGAEIAFIDSFY